MIVAMTVWAKPDDVVGVVIVGVMLLGAIIPTPTTGLWGQAASFLQPLGSLATSHLLLFLW